MAKDTVDVSQEVTGAQNTAEVVATTLEKTTVTGTDEYTAAELIAGYKAFKTQPECIAAALKMAGAVSATEAEAQAIVENFLKQEVKK